MGSICKRKSKGKKIKRKRLVNGDLEKNGKQKAEQRNLPRFYRESSICWGGIWGVLTALRRILRSSAQASVHSMGNISNFNCDRAGDTFSQFVY